MPTPRIAIITDRLTDMGEAEIVALGLHEVFPNAPIYTGIFTPETMPKFKNLDIRTTFLQNLPGLLHKLPNIFPILRVNAFKKLDLSEFDIIISNSSADSKQITKTRSNQIHICYCHSVAQLITSRQRKLDNEAAQRVDVFIAKSSEVQKLIQKYYGKTSTIIYPPVDVDRFEPARTRSDFYVTIGDQSPDKRIGLVVSVANNLNIPLYVFGNGSEHQRLIDMAGPTIKFFTDRFGDASEDNIVNALNNAKGYIQPYEEYFGIVQVEALAAGTPVIAYSKSGTSDIIQDHESGILFNSQTASSIIEAVKLAETIDFLPGSLRRKARRFDKSLFITKIHKIVGDQIK